MQNLVLLFPTHLMGHCLMLRKQKHDDQLETGTKIKISFFEIESKAAF